MITIPKSKTLTFNNAHVLVTVIGHSHGLFGIKEKKTGFTSDMKIDDNISEQDLKNHLNSELRKDKYVNRLLDINTISVQIMGVYKDPYEETTNGIWDAVFSADYEYKDGMIQ